MRIAFDLRCLSIPEKASRGTGSVLRDLVEGLAKIAPEGVAFEALVAPGEETEWIPERFRRVLLPWAYGDISRSNWYFESRRTGRFLRRLAPDLYHSPDLYIPRGFPGPMTVTVHDCYDLPLLGSVRLFDTTYGWRWNIRFRFRYRATWRALRAATRVIANSRTTANRVAALHPFLAPRLRPILWGLSETWFAPVVPQGDALASFGFSRPVVLHVGGFESRKNPRGVLETFRRIRAERPEATLVLVGPSHGARPEEPGVKFLGRVDDATLRRLYDAADLLLFPSFEEGYGRPVAEALARGCPVVTSRGTATEEVAGGLARLVDPADLDALYAACMQTLDSPRPAPRQGLRRNDDVARDYLDLFREAVHANLPRK